VTLVTCWICNTARPYLLIYCTSLSQGHFVDKETDRYCLSADLGGDTMTRQKLIAPSVCWQGNILKTKRAKGIITVHGLFVCLFSWRYNQLWLYFHSPVAGFSLLVFEVSWSHNDAPQSVGLLWASDQSVAETSTWQHTTLTTDKHPCPGWDSKPESQQASGQRPTP
jgi:hypothetical protein